MTAQIPDYIHYKGELRALYCNPLELYFEQHPPRPELPYCSSGCWRGYVATWNVVDDRLYLHALRSEQQERRVHDVDGPVMWATNGVEQDILDVLLIFPDANGDVFAEWVTGELRIPDGEMLQYAHAGYCSLFERDIILNVENGVIIRERIVAPPAELVAELKARNEKNRVEHELYMKKMRARDESVERLHRCLIEHLSPIWECPGVFTLDLLVLSTGCSDFAEFLKEQLYDEEDYLDTLVNLEIPLEPLLDRFEDLWYLSEDEWREKWPELYEKHSFYYGDGSGPDIHDEEAEAEIKHALRTFFHECRYILQTYDISLAPKP